MGSDCERDPSSASSSTMVRWDWVYKNNGGTCVAIVVLDYCVLAADTRLSIGYNIYTRDYSKIYKLTDKSVLASFGFQGNIKAWQKNLATKHLVVEYVGEIVGLCVDDKREIEYQSRRMLQYESVCHFFRIDKEHIIDATHKGGIARFVNHSCRPNYVAKVISVKNIRLFSSPREIYTKGEEITYDYHFNHEDEGEKIISLCNTKNSRLYLN